MYVTFLLNVGYLRSDTLKGIKLLIKQCSGLTKDDIEILGVPRDRITEKEWKSILSFAKYENRCKFLLKDKNGLDVIPKIEYEWYVK